MENNWLKKEKTGLKNVKHISILLKSQRVLNINELCEYYATFLEMIWPWNYFSPSINIT